MPETRTFELETVSNREEGILQIKDREATLANVNAILSAYPVKPITNDIEKKEAKETRATFNKIVKAIDRTRIDAIADFTRDFELDCKEIKDLFDERQKQFGIAIKEYEDSQKVALVESTEKAREYVATIKFTDEKLIKKITDFCEKNQCKLSIK